MRKRLVPTAVLFFLLPLTSIGKEETVKEDFSAGTLGKDWKVSSDSWKVDDGELRGKGQGFLGYGKALSGDFALKFDAQTQEKANIEVTLLDKTGEKVLYTLAFMGKYHTVLDGPKSAILKHDRFVSVSARMWIFPGRFFSFEVRKAKNQLQMFLNKGLGPTFTDDDPPAELDELLVQIHFAPEGKKDGVRIDNVLLTTS
jgi:hypothetical protein